MSKSTVMYAKAYSTHLLKTELNISSAYKALCEEFRCENTPKTGTVGKSKTTVEQRK